MRKIKLTENILKQLSSKISDNILSNSNIMSTNPIEGMKDINVLQKKIESNEEIEEKWSEKYKKRIDCNNPKLGLRKCRSPSTLCRKQYV